ncbi:tetratricopeptide repeat protein (plasmid) [Devosia sp. A8/3-2]|nr:tetratricopeptide repeat protein [Devosia sp. A8/3-2]
MEQRFDDAVSLLERARILDPGNADVLVQLGFAQLGLGNRTGARRAFEQAPAIAPSYQDARFGLAQIAFRSGNLAEARRLTEIVLEAQPDNGEAKQLLTSIMAGETSETKPPAQSDAPSQPVEETKPAPSRLGTTLAQAQKLRGEARFAEAEALYRTALTLSPGNADVLVALGQSPDFSRDSTRPRSSSRRHSSAPDYLDASLGLARPALQRGDLAGARTLVDAIAAERPDKTEVFILAARISLQGGEVLRAKEQFEAVLEREPDNAEALVGLGDTYRASGDDVAARTRYDAALALEPGSADIQQRSDQPPPRKWRVDIGTEVSDLTGEGCRGRTARSGFPMPCSPQLRSAGACASARGMAKPTCRSRGVLTMHFRETFLHTA